MAVFNSCQSTGLVMCREKPASMLSRISSFIPYPLRAIPGIAVVAAQVAHQIVTAAIGQPEIADENVKTALGALSVQR